MSSSRQPAREKLPVPNDTKAHTAVVAGGFVKHSYRTGDGCWQARIMFDVTTEAIFTCTATLSQCPCFRQGNQIVSITLHLFCYAYRKSEIILRLPIHPAAEVVIRLLAADGKTHKSFWCNAQPDHVELTAHLKSIHCTPLDVVSRCASASNR